MRPTQHGTNNDVLGAPPGMTIDECTPLPITRLVFIDGVHGVASFWLPTAAELALLNTGRAVRFVALGHTHPPVIMGVDGDGVML